MVDEREEEDMTVSPVNGKILYIFYSVSFEGDLSCTKRDCCIARSERLHTIQEV